MGFPGETEEQFLETMDLVNEVRFDSAFTFIYSPRKGTAAALMPEQIPEGVSSERIQRLITLQESLQKETLSRYIGLEEQILTEGISKRSSDAVSGRGKHGVSITVKGSADEIGQLLNVRITGIKNNTLTAERMQNP